MQQTQTSPPICLPAETRLFPGVGRVLVKLDPEEEKTPGGIIKPKTGVSVTGTVCSTGPGFLSVDGKTRSAAVYHHGERVLLAPFDIGAEDIRIGDVAYRLTAEPDILGVMEER